MQFVFMLEDHAIFSGLVSRMPDSGEEKLRSTGRSVDLAQRVSHSFSFLTESSPRLCQEVSTKFDSPRRLSVSASPDMLLREATCRSTLPLMLSGRRGMFDEGAF